MKNSWITRLLSEDSKILKKIGAEPGPYHIMVDTRAKAIRIKDGTKEYQPISLEKAKDAMMILQEYKELESSPAVEGNPYRFNCALQTGTNTIVSANGLYYNKPPTAKEAIAIVEELRGKGKSALPNKAHKKLDDAIDKVIKWLEAKAGSGWTPSGGYDIPEARQEFEYKGTKYRVDIKADGKTSGESWFK